MSAYISMDPRIHALISNEMQPTVSDSSSSVTRYAKFILKTKIIFSKNSGVTKRVVFGVISAHTLFTNKVCTC